MNLAKKLTTIQQALKAPKDQYNSFSNFSYRSCESILEALKPHLGELSLVISDEIVAVGDRIYVKATAALSDGEATVQATAFAREPEQKKGMDSSQLTGSTSSYARKYALNGLFLIDDNKDADHHELTPNDKQWIENIISDPQAINQLLDPEYKSFIDREVKKLSALAA